MKKVLIVLFSCMVFVNASDKLVWPSPPTKARISFERIIQKAESLKIEKGFFSKMFDFIFGDEEDVLIKPYGIHIGIDEKIYVTDTGAQSLFVFDAKNNELKIIKGTKKQNFVSPIDVKTDNGNNIYITDSMLKKVFVFNSEGEFVRFIGDEFNFHRPTGIVLNNIKETIYISDTVKSTIEIFSFDGRHLNTVGKYGKNELEFNKPTFLAIDNNENIYIADSMNQRIQIMDTNDNFIRMFGEMGKSAGNFANPRGLAVDKDNNIYVSDTLFNAIQIFNNKGQLLMVFGNEGIQKGEFSLPAGIAIHNEKILISDSYNMRVQEFRKINYDE